MSNFELVYAVRVLNRNFDLLVDAYTLGAGGNGMLGDGVSKDGSRNLIKDIDFFFLFLQLCNSIPLKSGPDFHSQF